MTILPSIVRFEFDDHRITVIDTPGQETYANNRFFGMFQADCALVVIDVVEGVMPITHQVLRILKGFEIPVHGVALTNLKEFVRARSGFTTSDGVLEPLSEIVRRVCEVAIRNATREGRRTVLDRDIPES